jgi:GTP cyclohydrolase I
MHSHENTVRLMPDVAGQVQPHLAGALDWVGMDGIEVPVRFDAGDGDVQRASAQVGAFVNLTRPDKRGIHMSRLYLLVDEYLSSKTVDAAMLESLLRAFLDSHKDLADRARISIRFDQLVRRAALRSDNSGWRAYPVSIEASLCADGFRMELGTEVVYSSTCPASAALSRQLIQEQFAKDFDAGKSLDHAAVLAWLGSEKGIVATPHAQRSVARLLVRFVDDAPLNFIQLARHGGAIAGHAGTDRGQARRRTGLRTRQRQQPDVLRRRGASHPTCARCRQEHRRFPCSPRTSGKPASARCGGLRQQRRCGRIRRRASEIALSR